jgi:GAF domain-containing protein
MSPEASTVGGDQSVEELRRELAEAREQQAATAEILRVISSSPTDPQRVFAEIAESAARLCDAYDATIHRVDGDLLRLVDHHGPIPAGDTFSLTRGFFIGRAVLDRRTNHSADLQAETDEYPMGSELARHHGFRTILAVPLIRAGDSIGVIAIRRTEVRPFTDRQVELLKTFADQAVIAIENARLLNELRESLQQLTATADVLKVMSTSPDDVQPVFDAIVANAARLCGAAFSAVAMFEGGLLQLVAVNKMSPEETAAYHTVFPRPPGRHFIMGRAFVDRQPVHVADIEADPDYDPRTLATLKAAAPYRTFLGIPILRDGIPIGAIGCGRRDALSSTIIIRQKRRRACRRIR